MTSKILIVLSLLGGGVTQAKGLEPPLGVTEELNRLFGKLRGADTGTRCDTAKEIAKFGAFAVSGLTAQLKDGDASLRAGAADALGLLGEQAEQALPELEACILDPEAVVRSSAIDAVHKIGQLSGSSKKKVLDALGDSDTAVLNSALWVIARQSLYDHALKEKIQTLLGSPNPAIRMGATDVLAKSEVLEKSFRSVLEGLLEDPVAGVQAGAILVLANMKLVSDKAVRKFLDLCKDGNKDVIMTLEWGSDALKKARFNDAEAAELVLLRNSTKDVVLLRLLNALDLESHEIARDGAHNLWVKIANPVNMVMMLGFNNYEMYEDGHKELAAIADAMVLTGMIFEREKPVRVAYTGWDNLMYSGTAILVFYPLTGLFDGYMNGDSGKVTRGWMAVGVSALSIGLEIGLDIHSRQERVAALPLPAHVGLKHIPGGGSLAASWRY